MTNQQQKHTLMRTVFGNSEATRNRTLSAFSLHNEHLPVSDCSTTTHQEWEIPSVPIRTDYEGHQLPPPRPIDSLMGITPDKDNNGQSQNTRNGCRLDLEQACPRFSVDLTNSDRLPFATKEFDKSQGIRNMFNASSAQRVDFFFQEFARRDTSD